MAFSVKVDVQHRDADQAQLRQVDAAQSSVGRSDAANVAADSISFSAGNPRVEHITGVVHLYRDVPVADLAQQPAWTQPEQHGDMLAVLAVSPDMGIADFCTWTGGYLPSVRELRFVRRDDSRNSCLVLLRFDAAATAAAFHKEHNNKPFWTLEPDVICRLVFIKDVQYDEGSGHSGSTASPAAVAQITAPAASSSRDGSPGASSSTSTQAIAGGGSSSQLRMSGLTELPTCPVCLERLDAHISGIVTTVCNHRFHNECLMRWADTSCPVCRYCLDSEGHVSHCTTCNAAADLWICLICGHIGCGRYRSGHANGHWKDTNHCYALELETQRVWDYASDGYVHRLIQSKTDGKLVEVPSPAPAPREEAGAASSGIETRFDADMEEALVSSKLDAIGQEYNLLLAGQLEEQRRWYDGRHAQVVSELEARCAQLSAAVAQSQESAAAAKAAASEAQRLQKSAEARLAREAQRARDLSKERDVLDALNSQMRANQVVIKQRAADDAAAAAAQLAQRETEVCDLKEQVHDLMMFLEGQRQLAEAGPDVQQGSVSIPPQPVSPPNSRTKRRATKGRQ
jgi:BRCA1-associated protein